MNGIGRYYVAHKMIFHLARFQNSPITDSSLPEDISKENFATELSNKNWIDGTVLCYYQQSLLRFSNIFLGAESAKLATIFASIGSDPIFKKIFGKSKSTDDISIYIFSEIELPKIDGNTTFGTKSKIFSVRCVSVWSLGNIMFHHARHITYMPARVLSPAETETLLVFNRIPHTSLPSIDAKDVSVLWADAKKGDVIEYQSRSQNTGFLTFYRRVL